LPARDEDLRGEAILDVVRYPEMRFESTKVTPGSHGTLRIDGSLTMHGITRPLTLQAKLNKEGPNPFDHRPILGFRATGSLRRSDFGMSKYLPLIGDIVSITIDIEFNRPA
jgi:polyisoprenoid-binding protein YceI